MSTSYTDPLSPRGGPPATEHGRAGESVARQLREDIRAGEFAPGTRLRQTDLAKRYGASRAPVREALRTLTAEGLISSVANSGAWIAKLSLTECDELYRVREQLEPLLLEFTVPGFSEDGTKRLHGLAEQMMDAEEYEDFLALDREFHMLTYAGAETLVLGDAVHRLWDRTQHYRRAFLLMTWRKGPKDADHDHFLIAAAIARGDVTEASQALRMHIRRTRLRLTKHPEIFEPSSRSSPGF